MPGLPVRVHDAYVAGEGILHASLLGLFPVVDMRGTSDVAEGELMRFFAEAAWYPTALLPSQGVRWEAVDDNSAYATLTEGDISVSALLLVVLIGFVLIPVMAIVSVVPFVHAGYAAYRVSKGEDYRYPFAADLVQKR